MAILLDHTIVPAKDKAAAAEFFADIFGLAVKPGGGHFAQVQVNDSLTLDFADDPEPSQRTLRLPRQRGGVRGDLRLGEGQRASLRESAVQPHRRSALHAAGAGAGSTSTTPTATCWKS